MSEEQTARLKTLDVINQKETANLIKGIVIFDTNVELPEGVTGLVVPNEDNEDKVILNPMYKGGSLQVKMKIVGNTPNRFDVGEKIATLVLL